MDCPLNWVGVALFQMLNMFFTMIYTGAFLAAHQQDRKAEVLVNHKKFADAILCHQKASEFLQEAMKMTQVKQALVSLQLQINSHCQQQRILKEKWKRCEIEQEKKKQEQARVIQESPNHEMVKSDIGLPAQVKPRNIMELVDGKKETECLQSSSLVISAENFSVSSTSSSSDCAGSKDEKSAVKDLEGQVSDLQMQVLSLSQDLEDCNRENSRLKKALDNVREFVKFKFGYEIEDEMLDFSLVKSQCVTQSELFSSNASLIQGSKDSNLYSEEDLKGEDQGVTCKDIGAETTDSDFDKDIPLPALETPQFTGTYEDEDNKEATS